MALAPVLDGGPLDVIPAFVQSPSGEVNLLQGAENCSVGTMTTTIVSGDYNYNVTVINNHFGPVSSSDEPNAPICEILAWIKGPDFLKIYEEALNQRMSKTGIWFIESEEFRNFVEGRDVVVWGTGMPGAGKTILSSTSTEHLKEVFEYQTGVAVICAFIRYTERLSTVDILSGLLRQLVSDHPCAYRHMEHIYVRNKGRELREQGLVKALRGIVGLLSKAFILIDGLDEAEDAAKDVLLHVLPSLGANVLIMSRPLELYRHHIPHALHVSIVARTEDIDLFIDDQIQRNSRLQAIIRDDPTLTLKLKLRVRESSKGMFLVARLQIEAVLHKARSVNSLLKALEQLPSGVNDMYRHTLERINAQPEEDVSIAHRVFIWLMYSVPGFDNVYAQSFSIAGLQHALAVSFDNETYDEGEIIPASMILSLCGGLVIFEEEHPAIGHGHSREGRSSFVRFIHYTAYEYLKGCKLYTQPPAQTLLAVSCLVYLTQHNDNMQELRIEDAWSYFYSRPLLAYADHTWGQHARSSLDNGPLHPFIRSFIIGCTKYGLFKHQFRNGYSLGDRVTPLHLAVMYDLVDVPMCNALAFEALPESETNRGGRETPLHYAAHYGCTSSLEILLTFYGNRINDIDQKGKTPLMYACRSGFEEGVKRLLAHPDVDVDLTDHSGRNAFWHACYAPSSLEGPSGLPALLLSSRPGIDVDTRHSRTGNTAFMGVCSSRQLEIVEWFLNRSARGIGPKYAEQVDQSGESALMKICKDLPFGASTAADSDFAWYSYVLEALRVHGANPSLQDTIHGISVLHCVASQQGPLPLHVLEQLLSWPTIDINQRSRYGSTATPLMVAASSGRPQSNWTISMIHCLLSKPQIDVNARASNGQTALMFATCSPLAPSVVEALLSHPDIDTTIQDYQGMSALDLACSPQALFGLMNLNVKASETIALLARDRRCEVSAIRLAVIKTVQHAKHRVGWEVHCIAHLLNPQMSLATFNAFEWTTDDRDTVMLLAHALQCDCQVFTYTILINCSLLPPMKSMEEGKTPCQCGFHCKMRTLDQEAAAQFFSSQIRKSLGYLDFPYVESEDGSLTFSIPFDDFEVR
ncbi:hypothetical protein D9611_007402 [Ephemerocybe angulata]|uniref:Nephrocystin 3-like N-terminal domain-containing protein n=1 Tax=Ephemerocybe angulata TaxID=980116 RepID=A0A8H5FLC4_9AGAR|nr:hypothetical protein D9611_007402 [Tulosesus angulatus]